MTRARRAAFLFLLWTAPAASPAEVPAEAYARVNAALTERGIAR